MLHPRPTFAALAVLALATAARADVIFDATFEPPAYAAGPLVGQNGWAAFPSSNPPGAAVVQSNVVQNGTAALYIDAELTTNTSGNEFYVTGLNRDVTGQLVRVGFDFRRDPFDAGDPATSPSDWYGRVISPTTLTPLFAFGLSFQNAIIFSTPSGDAFEVTPPVAINDGEWHRYEALLDFADGSADVTLDGVPVVTPGSGLLSGYTPVINDVSLLALFPTFDKGVFDDLLVETVVPEPGAALTCVAFGALAARRRPR